MSSQSLPNCMLKPSSASSHSGALLVFFIKQPRRRLSFWCSHRLSVNGKRYLHPRWWGGWAAFTTGWLLAVHPDPWRCGFSSTIMRFFACSIVARRLSSFTASKIYCQSSEFVNHTDSGGREPYLTCGFCELSRRSDRSDSFRPFFDHCELMLSNRSELPDFGGQIIF